MDGDLRRALERAVGEVDGAPASRFEARRRAESAVTSATALLRSEGYYQPVVEDIVEGEETTVSKRMCKKPGAARYEIAQA